MNYFNQIQFEFTKIALNWDDLSLKQQQFYLKKHPKSKKHITAKPKAYKSVELLSSIIKDSPWKNKAFLAGGFVRDSILGKPSKDIDVTVEAHNGGIELAKYISEKLNIREPVIFPTFGTAKIQLPNGYEIEFVQTRTEEYMKGSRKPQTSYGSLKDDVKRRDFTINTLLLDLTTGKILDVTGKGLNDLKQGIIRTPLDPDATFKDDPLRMMRAIRFSTKYGFELDDEIMPSLKKNAKELKNISMERIHDEFNKILLTDQPSKGLSILMDTGLLNQFIPELKDLRGLEQGKYHDRDICERPDYRAHQPQS